MIGTLAYSAGGSCGGEKVSQAETGKAEVVRQAGGGGGQRLCESCVRCAQECAQRPTRGLLRARRRIRGCSPAAGARVAGAVPAQAAHTPASQKQVWCGGKGAVCRRGAGA